MIRLLLFSFLFFTGACLIGQDQWNLRKDEDQIKVWTQKTNDSKFDSFKAASTITASLENILALLFDVENSHEYYETIRKVFNAKRLCELEAEYYVEFNFPWPVSDRVTKAYSKISLLPDGKVEVHTKSIPYDIDRDGKVIISSMISLWTLNPIDRNTTEVELKGHIDPSGSIPAWIANRTVVDTPHKALKKLTLRLPIYKDVDLPFVD